LDLHDIEPAVVGESPGSSSLQAWHLISYECISRSWKRIWHFSCGFNDIYPLPLPKEKVRFDITHTYASRYTIERKSAHSRRPEHY
jgi:hypothetical protein